MVTRASYVPDRGDIVWLEFNPQQGHEQAGKRPALVLSPKAYNAKTGLAIFCPVTSQIKDYPFEIILTKTRKINGAVLCDQVKSLDWKARKASYVEKCQAADLNAVQKRISLLIL